MIDLNLTRKNSGVPILSRADMDEVAFQVLADFNYKLLLEPQELDIDLFAQDYLGMDQDFQLLSHNGIYMGMTIFNDTDRLPVFDPVMQRAEYVSEQAGTIVIDSRLLEPGKEDQYKYTMAHESIHGMLHKAFFDRYLSQITISDQIEPLIRCRKAGPVRRKNWCNWTELDWMEWQANTGASALLMPAPAVKIISDKAKRFNYWGMPHARVCIEEMRRVFKVSHSVAAYRLQSLNLLDPIIMVTEKGGLTYRDK